MRRTLLFFVSALVVAGAALATSQLGGNPVIDVPPAPTVVPVPTTTTAPTTEPSPTVTATAVPTPTPIPTEDGTEAEVAAVQQSLTELGYYVGAVDGKAGPATASAVQAFQKVNGLSADGVIGPNTIAAMADPAQPALVGGPATRVEVDLDTQVLVLVEGGSVSRILPISSGSGDRYSTAGGGTAESVTPVGTYTVERRISGERHAPLGTLYDPMYFYRGWAIHGSNSVPAYPASHGCVRVTRADAKWLFERVGVGMPIVLHGDRNAFDPRQGESAGTAEPAGDTPDTTPPDGIQTPEPTPGATEPAPAPEPSQPAESQPTTAPPAEPTTPPEPTPTGGTTPDAQPPPAAPPTPVPEVPDPG